MTVLIPEFFELHRSFHEPKLKVKEVANKSLSQNIVTVRGLF